MNDFEEQGTRKSLHDGYKAKSCVGDACVGTKKGFEMGDFGNKRNEQWYRGCLLRKQKGFKD
jgi:hypothetical protein